MQYIRYCFRSQAQKTSFPKPQRTSILNPKQKQQQQQQQLTYKQLRHIFQKSPVYIML